MKTVDTLNGSELNGRRIKLIEDKTRQRLHSGGSRSRSRSPRARSRSAESMTKTSTFGTFSASYAWECSGCRLQNIPERRFCYHCNTKKPVLPNDEETVNTGIIFIHTLVHIKST